MKDFTDNYTLVEGLSEHWDDGNPLLEVYGKDLETVKKIGKKNPRKVWTVLDVGLNYLIVVAGLHKEHRLFYVISVQEWKDENEEYIY